MEKANLEDVLVCLQEALKNAMRFGDAPIELDLLVDDEAIRAMVRDHGMGFGPGPPDHLALLREPPDPLAVSGRGLFLMASLMDELELMSDGGAEVRLVKRLAPAERHKPL